MKEERMSDEEKLEYVLKAIWNRSTSQTLEEISLLEAIDELKENDPSNKRERKRAQRSKDYYSKKVERIRKELSNLYHLFVKYNSLAREVRLDGNTVNSVGEVNTDYIYDIENVIVEALEIIGKKNLVRSISTKESIKREEMHKVQLKIEKLIKKSGIIYENENSIEDYIKVSDLFDYGEVFDKIIAHRKNTTIQSPTQIILKGTKIEVDIEKFYSEREEYCQSLIPKISEITELLKSSDLSSNAHVKLEESQRIYKEYAKKFVAYKIIEYFIPMLQNHTEVINNLKKLVIEEEKKCYMLKDKADKIFYSVNFNERDSYVAPEEKNVESQIDEPTADALDKQEESKLTEIELKSISSGYRVKYIEERLKGSELGSLDYSEYLEKKCPNQVELIVYIKVQEKKAETLYKEYLKDRTKRIANEQPVISFKNFVKIKTGIEYSDANIELPIEIEEALKKMKTL